MKEPSLEQMYYTDEFIYLTDKGNGHSYIEHYSEMFEEFRHTATSVVELGVCRGGSIKLWRKYFSKAKIIAFDIYPDCTKHTDILNNIYVHTADCTDPNILKSIPDDTDIIIDDASHILEQSLESFRILWPKVRKGGLYIIEDIPDIDTWLKEFIDKGSFQIIDNTNKRISRDNTLFVFRK